MNPASNNFDFLVIGGGIAGISVSAQLASESKVAVLEAEEHLGYHSTGRSAAIFIRNYGNQTLRQLNDLSIAGHEGEAVGEPVLSNRGELLVASAASSDQRALEDYLQSASGVEHLNPRQTLELVPCLKRASFESALYEPDARDIDVSKLLQGYTRQLKQQGGKIYHSEQAIEISRLNNLWQVTSATGNTYRAKALINAAGAWADQVAMLAGAQAIGLQPMRRSIALMGISNQAHNAAGFASWPLFGSIAETWYAKPETSGLLISPADEDPVEPQDIWPEDEVLALGIDRFEQAVDLPLSRLHRSWAGLRTFAPDRTPVVGEDPSVEGFYWLAGQGGYGIQTAPATAKLLASICLQNNPSSIGKGNGNGNADLLQRISPERFAVHDPG